MSQKKSIVKKVTQEEFEREVSKIGEINGYDVNYHQLFNGAKRIKVIRKVIR